MSPAEIKTRLLGLNVPARCMGPVIDFFAGLMNDEWRERERTFEAKVEKRAVEIANERAQSDLIDVPEAAGIAGVCRKTIRRAEKDHSLRGFHPFGPKRLRFLRADVLVWAAHRQCPPNVHETEIQIAKRASEPKVAA